MAAKPAFSALWPTDKDAAKGGRHSLMKLWRELTRALWCGIDRGPTFPDGLHASLEGKFLLELIEVGLFEVSLPQSSKGTLLLKI